jgi:hypothetical protein
MKAVTMKLHEQDENLEHILESAVIVRWADLMGRRSGLIHVEYGFAPGGTVDFLEIWSSIRRGYWLLACTYRMSASPSHDAGVQFDNGYESESLAHILDVVMHQQQRFVLPQNLGHQGLLQIATPTAQESKAAAALINETVAA